MPEYRVLLLGPSPTYYGDYLWTYDGETPEPGQTITITTVTAGPDSLEARVQSVDDDDPRTITAEQLPESASRPGG